MAQERNLNEHIEQENRAYRAIIHKRVADERKEETDQEFIDRINDYFDSFIGPVRPIRR